MNPGALGCIWGTLPSSLTYQVPTLPPFYKKNGQEFPEFPRQSQTQKNEKVTANY